MGSVRFCHQKKNMGTRFGGSSRSTFKTFHHRQASLILSSMARSRHSQEAWWCLFCHCWRWYCTLKCFGSYEKWPKNIKNRFFLYILTKVWKLVLEGSYGHTIIPPQFQCLKFGGSWNVLAPMTLVVGASLSSQSVLFGTCFKALLKC